MTKPVPDNATDREQDLRQAAAVFLGQVLGLEATPQHLAGDLSSIKRDANASIYTIQLDSSVGPAAFLVYAYVLADTGGNGRTGKELFDTGLATLQQAAQRSSPGPRAVAHAESGRFGFILATTPGTYRALTGDRDIQNLVASSDELLQPLQGMRPRGEIAMSLLDALKAANASAAEWLVAIRTSDVQGSQPESSDYIEFTDEETELALFLLDDQSIADLLHSLNLLVTAARERAAQATYADDLPNA